MNSNFNDKNLPNVLLLGNGMITSCAKLNGIKNHSWNKYIEKLSNENSKDKPIINSKNIPYSLKATLIADKDDAKRQKQYANVFKTLSFDNNTLIKELVQLEFQAILTTNYTYEIEDCFLEGYSALKSQSKLRYAKSVKRGYLGNKPDTKYLLHTYNKFKTGPQIWHIHGEERRPSSIILTHDEYSRLINRLITENKYNENKYIEYANDLHYKSWLDYILMGNLYIVGLGMDFSEFDLWWVLNRRIREKAKTGKIYFFDIGDTNKDILAALKRMGVKIERPPEFKSKNNFSDEDYINFYKNVTETIKQNLKRRHRYEP